MEKFDSLALQSPQRGNHDGLTSSSACLPHQRETTAETRFRRGGAARTELLGSSYLSVRQVACRLRDGVLTLQGHVPSYFHKQVAQAMVLQCLDRSVRIDNQLRVVGMRSS